MTTTYSIAEARDKFAAVIREAEATDKAIYVTRRGRTVAVILSADEYAHLLQDDAARPDFWTAYLQWREDWKVNEWDESVDPFADVRDRSPGREDNPWQ